LGHVLSFIYILFLLTLSYYGITLIDYLANCYYSEQRESSRRSYLVTIHSVLCVIRHLIFSVLYTK